LKLVDGGGGERTQLPSLGKEDTAATAAFGSMEAGGCDGERLLAGSSLVAVPNKKHLSSHLISFEDSGLTTGLRRFAMGLPICRIKHSGNQDQVVKFVRKIQNKVMFFSRAIEATSSNMNLALLD
jgi:hypothetical protein